MIDIPSLITAHRADLRNLGEYSAYKLLAERIEAVRREALAWDDDAKDEWSEQIDAAFPTRSGSHEQYGQAMEMVGRRRSKGALVALVNWLLVRAKAKR